MKISCFRFCCRGKVREQAEYVMQFAHSILQFAHSIFNSRTKNKPFRTVSILMINVQ